MKKQMLACAAFFVAAIACAENHVVTFRKMDGTVLSRVEVAHGGSVTAPTAPTVSGYTFNRWDHGDWLGCVTNNVTCWALYEWTDKSKTPDSKTNIDCSNIGTREQPYTLDEFFQLYNNLAWTDEFSGSSLKSNFYGSRSHTNGELCQKQNANRVLENGLLKLRVKREKSGNYNFTSGEITTSGKVTFKRGRIEIRAKLNAVRGQWPSFWTMHSGWTSDYNEIDVFEQLSGSDWIGGTLHAGHGGIPRTSCSSRGCPEDGFTFSEGFHRIGAIVTEKELIWYVDDHIFKRLDLRNEPWAGTPTTAKYILLCSGLCAGGWLEGLGPELKCATEADVPADFQQEDYEIDYLRVYTNTRDGNTVSYDAAPSTAKLSGPVRASVWTGYDLSDYLSNVNSINLWGSNGYGYDNVNFYIRTAIGQYFEREKADVVVFLRVPTDSDHEKKGSSDIPGVSAAFIDNPIMSTRKNDNNQTEAYETNYERRSGVFFNHDRFAPGEANLGELDLGMGSTFTNLYAICADLKEKSTGARVKVVGVNVVSTNGIENASSNVSKAFNTLFSKLNLMKQNGDKVIVILHSTTWGCYSYAKTLANNGIGANYEWVGQNGNWPAYQHVYVSKNRQSASVSVPDKLTVPKKNLTMSYSNKPAAAVATVVFDDLPPEEPDGYADEFVASNYAKAMNVTVTGYSGTALANFPVLVKLSTAISGFKYSDFRLPNGGDLRFTDASGNLIPHEIDTWNPSGVSTVWVKVPSLVANARVIAFYGCDTPVRPLAEKVWDSDYVGVWHLGESGLPLKESSGNSNDFTYQSGTGVGYAASGVVGSAVNFPSGGLTNSLVSLDHDNLDGFTKFTIEAWTKQAAHKDAGGILSKREVYNREASYWFYDKAGSTMLRATTNGTSGVDCISTIQPGLNKWNHQVYTLDTTTSSSNFKGYLNGAAAGTVSKAFGKIFAGRGNLILGNLNPDAADNSFNGQIDEVRISRCVRSAEWIKATYDTITSANFLTCTMATTPYSSSYGQLDMSAFAKRIDVTFSGYSGTTLANFPVLVKLSTTISGFSYSDFSIPSGGDLRFADASGKLIPHEIDTWNPNGVSTVWVKVPSLTANAKITACYGCSEPPLVASKDVWDDDYVGVWHLGEAALPMKESSRTSTDFSTSAGSGIGFSSAGIVGGSVDFGESGTSRALFADDHDALDGFSKCTIEAWTYMDASRRSFQGGSNGTDLNKGLISKRVNSSSEASYYLFDTGSQTQIYVSTNGTKTTNLGSYNVPSGKWTHQAFTFDCTTASSNVGGWTNGVRQLNSSKTITPINAGSAKLILGNLGASDTRNFPGKIDEVRISKVARSAAWLKATHDTVVKANFATYAMSAEPAPDPNADPVASNFSKFMTVFFRGAQYGTSLTNFPVLVKLSTAISGFKYTDFKKPNGGDLRFSDSDGNWIPHEIDTWNSNGVSTVWVKVPHLTRTGTITAYYGATNPGRAPAAKDVWDDDYVGVWHLGESALPMKESSETSSDFASSYGKTIGYGADGIVGKSVNFPAGGLTNALMAADHDALDGFSKFTIETWTYQDAHKNYAGILTKRKDWGKEDAYFIQDGTSTMSVYVGTNRNTGVVWVFSPTQTMGKWNHMVHTVDMTTSSSNVRGYKNGTMNSWVNSVKFRGLMPNCASDLYLGNLGANNKDNSFNGKIDEVRISKTVRSAEWIKATYETIASDTFTTCLVGGGTLPSDTAVSNMLLKAKTDKANPIDYVENEDIRFDFFLDGVDLLPQALESKSPLHVIWTRTADDGVTVKGTNTISLAQGFSVTTKLAIPGIVKMTGDLVGKDYKKISYTDPKDGKTTKYVSFGGGAGVATEKMQLSTVEPADFDQFWREAKTKLATVSFPTDGSELTEVFPNTSNTNNFRYYAASIPCFGPRPVTGWLVVPKSPTAGGVPVQASFDGYGCIANKPSLPTVNPGQKVYFAVNAHGYDMVGHDNQYYKDFNDYINKTNRTFNGTTYGYALAPQDYDNPTNTYFYYMAMRVMRAFQYLKSRPEWNGKDVIATGGSQGGLQTMWAGGLVDGITQIQPQITWGCDIGCPWNGKGPYPSRTWGIPCVPGAYYFDSALHAKRVPRDCIANIARLGMGDYTCPPRGVLLSYYNMRCKVSAKLVQGSDHGYVPPSPNQVFTISKEAAAELPPAFASDAAGFDYTNRVVTVTNATAGSTLTLTATGSDGTTTTATATVNANGEATFDVATAPGASYDYTVASGGDTIASGGFFTGGWSVGETWFSASAKSGSSVVSGGAWKSAPAISNKKYAIDGTAEFALGEDAVSAGAGRLVRVDVDVSFGELCSADSLIGSAGPEYSSFVAVSSSGSAKWMASGANGWVALYGDVVPQPNKQYVVRAEADFAGEPPQIRYEISEDNGAAFAPLYTDSDRTSRWIPCASSGSELSKVDFDGVGAVASLGGVFATANIAAADGVGYESLADAVAAATNSLVLLTNATWPTNTPVGTTSVNLGGYTLKGVTLDGSGKAVVQSGYSQIPGEGRVNITLAQAAALGVATNGKSPAQIASALAANGANGIPRWKSYVLGLDPTVATAKPQAMIVMNGDKVELALVGIDVNESAGATVTYRVYKFSDLSHIQEQLVGSDRDIDVTAEVPKSASEPRMFYRLKVDVKGY